MSLFWELHQQRRIADARSAADAAGSRIDNQAATTDELKRSVDRLALACQAMWELLRDQAGIADQDLEAKILEVDGRDGKVDGRVGSDVITCPACGRKSSAKRDRCIMCGASTPRTKTF